MANPLDSNIRHSHTFLTQDLTQGQIPGANPSRLLALPEEILDVITRRISSGGTPQENAANAIAWGRVAVLPHIMTQALHVEHVLDKAKYLDEALVVLWQYGIAFQLRGRAPEMTTAREIRAWMADPANAALLNTITEITLTHHKPGETYGGGFLREDDIRFRILPPEVDRLKVIPPEINALTNLGRLWLSNNQITQIGPRTFAGCPNLWDLHLGNNQITQIDHEAFTGCRALNYLYLNNNRITQITPRTFVDCQNLNHLNLNYNQIAQIDDQTFIDLLTLRMLDLSNNRITQINFNTFAGCISLEFLHLHQNQITHLDPLTFASIPRLTRLSLSGNQITRIHPKAFTNISLIAPYAFTNCQHLIDLSLSDNQITYIDPLTFAFCPALEDLYLSNNQITYIHPGTFIVCPALRHLSIYNHSLLYTLNTNHRNHLPMFNALSRYVCRSPLADFYKALYEGVVPLSDAAELLKGLEDRNLIYEMVYWEAKDTAEHEGKAFNTGRDPQWGENHVCDDKAIFCRALKRAVQEKFNRLSAEQKCAVHGAIYRIAREEAFLPLDSPEWNDPNWGENHREDNVLWLIDAMQGF